MDRDESTCLNVTYQNDTIPQLVTELGIRVAVEDAPDQRVLVEIKIKDTSCNGTVIFFKASSPTAGCQSKKVDSIVGKLLEQMQNSKSCFFTLPLDCEGLADPEEACEFNGFFAVNGGPGSVEVCEVQQG